MTDLPDPKRAREDPAEAERTQPAEARATAEVGYPQPGRTRQTDLEHASAATVGAARAPGLAGPPAGRPGWATGAVSFPSLLVGLVVAFAATLGLAAVGGWAGVAACALITIAAISLVVAWSE